MRALKLLVMLCAGYVIGALAGYAGIEALSPNRHDRAVEAAMTAAFVAGPAVAVLFLLLGIPLTRRRTQ